MPQGAWHSACVIVVGGTLQGRRVDLCSWKMQALCMLAAPESALQAVSHRPVCLTIQNCAYSFTPCLAATLTSLCLVHAGPGGSPHEISKRGEQGPLQPHYGCAGKACSPQGTHATGFSICCDTVGRPVHVCTIISTLSEGFPAGASCVPSCFMQLCATKLHG